MPQLRLAAGLALAATAGGLFGSAWANHNQAWSSLGLLFLVVGALVTLWAVHQVGRAQPAPGPESRWDVAAPPLLGELLVSVGLISRDDLGRALSRQRGNEKRLGEILVEMRLLTYAQLAEVLEEQLTRRASSLPWRGRTA